VSLQDPQLVRLHDIVLPEPVPWIPQTPGWIVLAVLAVLLVCGVVGLAVQRHRARRYRREALASLVVLERQLSGSEARAAALAGLPVLVKRTALAFSNRETVAALSGEAWLAYLDGTLGGDDFSRGPGRTLPLIAYGTPEVVAALGQEEVSNLTTLIRRWIRHHRV